jgi:signal peptidase I
MNKSLNKENSIPLKRKFKINWLPIVLAIILYFIINQLIFFTIGVPSDSMYPTITPGDKIWTLRIHDMSKIKRGDIIVFWNKEIGDMLVKRVIGLPNDKVSVSEDGSLVVNGKKLNENYATSKGEKSGEYIVPADSYFFLGDNLADSYDSRYWKNPYINKEDIKGKAWVRYYPFDRFGDLK